MTAAEDRELLALIAHYVTHEGAPIEPIVDRCIEMGHHAEDLGRSSTVRMVDAMTDFAVQYHDIWMIGSDVNDRLFELGHKELADWLPF